VVTASSINSSGRERGTERGWVVSIVVHAILLLLFYLYRIDILPFILDFTPVNFAPFSDVAETEPTSVHDALSGAPIVELPRRPMLDESSPLLQLPDRERPILEAVIPQERPEEMKPDLTVSSRRMLLPTAVTGRSDRPTASPMPVESSWLEGERQQSMNSKLAGDEMFTIAWEGTQRQKISGDLPKFPAGVNRASTVKLAFDVAPDGTVIFVSPSTKGVPELEQVSIEALRKWRFNPLDPSIPQAKQRGEITFVFTLK